MQSKTFVQCVFNNYVIMICIGSYPLRPELIESTVGLYHATRDPYLLHYGYTQLHRIKNGTKATCGYCSVQDVRTGKLEDKVSIIVQIVCAIMLILLHN
jgi:mannosidase alpha-like ER degradation enhancer 1